MNNNKFKLSIHSKTSQEVKKDDAVIWQLQRYRLQALHAESMEELISIENSLSEITRNHTKVEKNGACLCQIDGLIINHNQAFSRILELRFSAAGSNFFELLVLNKSIFYKPKRELQKLDIKNLQFPFTIQFTYLLQPKLDTLIEQIQQKKLGDIHLYCQQRFRDNKGYLVNQLFKVIQATFSKTTMTFDTHPEEEKRNQLSKEILVIEISQGSSAPNINIQDSQFIEHIISKL